MLEKTLRYAKRIKEGRLQEIADQISWMYKYLKSNLFGLILYTVIGLTSTLTVLISSLVSRDMVDIITGHNTGKLAKTFIIMISVTLLSTFLSQLSAFISAKISLRVEAQIKSQLFDEIMSIEWESLMKYKAGELSARWGGDASRIATGVLNTIPNLIINLFRFFSALIVVIKNDASFVAFALLGVPLSFLISRMSLRSLQKNNMSSLAVSAGLSSFNQEAFSNIQTVKAFDMVSLYSKRIREFQKEYANAQLKYQKATIINNIILTIVSLLVTYSAQGWGIYKVWSGAITYGTMTMFLALSNTLSATVNTLLNMIPNTISVANAARRLMDLTSLPKEDYSKRDEVKAFFERHKSDGVGIAIRDVSYSYPKSDIVFGNVFAEAHPHEVVAFVGPSGEGKTTMLRYILSIIRAQNGKGYICAGDSTPENGGECVEMSASARQLFAYVPQGNTMFSGTIASNMRNVKEDATDEEIIEALKLACAWRFVEKLPDGINSEIMERGGGFSEGQSQRLSIARALLRKSPILLLDEATSALDIATEREVLKNIMCDNYPRTCIVTTHRPSVLNVCSRVYSISDKKCTVMDKDAIEKMITDF